MQYNLLKDSDSYKTDHHNQFPNGTEYLYSHFEARGTDTRYKETVFFGLQYVMREYLEGVQVTDKKIEEAEKFCNLHGVPFNKPGWEYIRDTYQGKLPVRIKAVREGTVVPLGNTMMTIESTDPRVFWLGSFLETMLVRMWYPITVATISWQVKQTINRYLISSSDNPGAELPFKLHDFGARGVSSLESAGVGGMAHLTNFMGSDTMTGIDFANKYYDSEMAGFSIPASEHDTMTSWTREFEIEAYTNMFDKYGERDIFAIVLDSYNIWNAIDNIIGGPLKERIIQRHKENPNATVVIRPDSGDPIEVVLKCLEKLDHIFGSTINSKGYRVLDHGVRVIQGDGCTPQMIENILAVMSLNQYSTTNIAFGMGGGLLQKVNRDTFKFAFKGSMVRVNGEDRDIWKSPIDDPVKKSKKGYQSLIETDNRLATVNVKDHPDDLLEEVFLNGEILRTQTLDEVRAISEQTMIQIRI